MKKRQPKNVFLREEIKAEKRHLQYLLKEREMHPLEVAEAIITDVLSLLRAQIKQKHPSYSEKEIRVKMREKLASESKEEDTW